MKKYIERGDYFKVDNLEIFILNCDPDNGFITNDTKITYLFGLNREECLEKINNFDNEFAHYVSNFDNILIDMPYEVHSETRLNESGIPRSNFEALFDVLNSSILIITHININYLININYKLIYLIIKYYS
jgi:hypothetical protein